MENNQNSSAFAQATEDKQPVMATEQVLQEILENTRKTKRYMAWQFYITIILVVLPLLGLVFALPTIMSSLGGAYGGLIQ